MHYIPESCREFLQERPASGSAQQLRAEQSFHYRFAPIYVLTAVVGLLLLADVVLGQFAAASSDWQRYQKLFGIQLALIAAVLGAARILFQTLEGLSAGKIGADLALTIACLAAIVLKENVAAAIVVFIALCGESIEGFTVDRAQRAIRRVFNLCPPIAHLLRDGVETDVPVDAVVVSDTVVVRPGERIPVDGRVTAGTSAIDQSALTGESLPIDKAPGDEVFAGTLNQFGALTVRTEKIGGDTTLAQVVKLVAEATERKAPLERTADRLARLFLPVVLAIAGVTLIGWRIKTGNWSSGFLPALSVLVVACPCPLVLATPSAVMAAMAWLARTGVVVKGSIALERLAQVDTFVFDKTGTLTRGALTLGDVVAVPPLDETELLRTAAIGEKRSEHLLARLIVREAEARRCVVPEVNDFKAKPGSGIIAKVRASALGPWAARAANSGDGVSDDPYDQIRTLVVGNRRILESEQILIPPEFAARLAEFDESGQTVLLVALDGELLGVIGVRDLVRSETVGVLAELRREGIDRFALLTGDRPQPAQSVAKSLGLAADVQSEMLPQDKAQWIETETRHGHRVAMVGDGVNDAPALATATVGIALGGVGSDIAAEAGDLVLMGDPLKPLPGLLRLSRQLVRIIRQSIFLFAFGMNGLGMLLGSIGILSPAMAALFHEFSSLAVMLNALRLLWFERGGETWLGQFWERIAMWGDALSQSLSPTRAVFGFLEHWTLILRLGAAAAAVAWCCSGFVTLSEDEQALVTRFGRYETTLSAGTHFRWPVGLETIHRQRVGELRTISIGYRSTNEVTRPSGLYLAPIEWTSDHSNADDQTVPSESTTLTADEVPVELTGEVHYRIADLYRYVYGSAEPADVLRAAAENSIRQVAAQFSLDGLLTDQRAEIERRCLRSLRETLDRYELGVEVADLNLLDVHPPNEVVPAYRQVADALEEREQLVNEAEAYYARKVLSAAGEQAIRILSDSVGPAENSATTGGVTAWTLNDSLWQELTRVSNDGRPVLSGAAAAKLSVAQQERVQRIQSAEGAARRFNHLLAAYRADRALTGVHLFWQTVEQTLSSRPLTILDPRISGKQHMLLADPSLIGNAALLQQTLPSSSQPSEAAEMPREEE